MLDHHCFSSLLESMPLVVQVNQDGLKLNGAYQLLVDADDVIIPYKSVHTIKKYTEASVDAS
jgi:hypothetical protein